MAGFGLDSLLPMFTQLTGIHFINGLQILSCAKVKAVEFKINQLFWLSNLTTSGNMNSIKKRMSARHTSCIQKRNVNHYVNDGKLQFRINLTNDSGKFANPYSLFFVDLTSCYHQTTERLY